MSKRKLRAEADQALEQVLSVFTKWLYLPDTGVVEIALGTVAANRISGDPVWVLLTGPVSSGKTEVLNSLLKLPNMHPASTMTEAALLSGTARKDCAADATGGLLRQIGDFGIIVLKDFTSILSMNRDKQRATLAALREIYDGSWMRPLGSDGGRKLEWRGRAGLIGGVTSSIDSAHTVMSAMGQRFALYRLPQADAREQARRAIEKTGAEEGMRSELSDSVRDFFYGLDFDNQPVLSDGDREWVIPLTSLVATCRSAVERDGHRREIELIHDPEAPARLTRMLAQLMRGLQMIGVQPQRVRQLIVKVAVDCIPAVRRMALDALLRLENPVPLAGIAAETRYPSTTIRRALEDLMCHGIVEHGPSHSVADTWLIAEQWNLAFEIVRRAFPKCTWPRG